MIIGIATLGPFGRLPAPGTWGSALGVLWWVYVVHPLTSGRAGYHEVSFDLLVILAPSASVGLPPSLSAAKTPRKLS